MPYETLLKNQTSENAGYMLDHMSKDNAATLYKLIVTVYSGDRVAQEHEQKRKKEKLEAFKRLEAIRNEISASVGDDFDPEKELIAGLEEKYGSVD